VSAGSSCCTAQPAAHGSVCGHLARCAAATCLRSLPRTRVALSFARCASTGLHSGFRRLAGQQRPGEPRCETTNSRCHGPGGSTTRQRGAPKGSQQGCCRRFQAAVRWPWQRRGGCCKARAQEQDGRRSGCSAGVHPNRPSLLSVSSATRDKVCRVVGWQHWFFVFGSRSLQA
jgi:hypothetical protein